MTRPSHGGCHNDGPTIPPSAGFLGRGISAGGIQHVSSPQREKTYVLFSKGLYKFVTRCWCLRISAVWGSKASAAQAQGTSGWTYYPLGISLSEQTVSILSGARGPDGSCSFAQTESEPAGSITHYSIETGFNPTTCQLQLTKGIGSGDSPAAASATTTDAGTSQSLATSTSTAPIATGATDPAYSAYAENQWLDVINIQLNAQEQWDYWDVSNDCVTDSSDTTQWDWETTTGWYNRFTNMYPVNNGCASQGAQANSGFENDTFCALQYTTSYFGIYQGSVYNDYLVGLPTGSYSYDWYDSLGGHCLSLFHHGHQDA
jgi:hypothetical protein